MTTLFVITIAIIVCLIAGTLIGLAMWFASPLVVPLLGVFAVIITATVALELRADRLAR